MEWSLFFFSIEAMKWNSVLVLPSKQRLHNLRFLQKLGCQKPCWDSSSLVNKQVDFYHQHVLCFGNVFRAAPGKASESAKKQIPYDYVSSLQAISLPASSTL